MINIKINFALDSIMIYKDSYQKYFKEEFFLFIFYKEIDSKYIYISNLQLIIWIL